MALIDELKSRLINSIDLTRNLSDQDVYEIITKMVIDEYQDKRLSLKEKMRISRELYNSIRGLDILQDILEDDEITEIMINGYDNIFIEKQGKLFRYDGAFSSRERLQDIIQQIVAKANKRVNEVSPIVDTRLSDGSRVNVVLSPIALRTMRQETTFFASFPAAGEAYASIMIFPITFRNMNASSPLKILQN